MTILALCNPTSGGKPQRLDELHSLATRQSAAGLTAPDFMRVVATRNAQDAERALAEQALGKNDVLLLSGGDGTIQHALSWLLHHNPAANPYSEDELPAIALLPAGSTNMTALDINTTKGWQPSLAAFLRQIEPGHEPTFIQRRLVSVRDGDRRHAGFFVGAGAIVRGIEYCNEVLWAGGAARKERTAGIAMARTIWGVLRQQPPFDEREAMSVQNIPQTSGDSPVFEPASGALLFAASTLDRLLMGARPFWGDAVDEPLRYVLVERDALLLRGLPGLLGMPGFSRPVAAAGFHSHNCTRVTLRLDSAYAIDGELFKPREGLLELDVDRSLRFFVL